MSFSLPAADTGEPFAVSGLDALLAGAAELSPEAIILRDDEGALSAAVVARRVRRLAEQFRLAGLVRGERILVVAAAQATAVVALAAALRLGLEPVVAPCGLLAPDLAARAAVAQAVALIGPSRYGSLDLGEGYLDCAALVDTVRLVATLGPDVVDGALDVAPAVLDACPEPLSLAEPRHEGAIIGTFGGEPGRPVLVAHRQAALLADALSLVEQARINPTKHIVSTLAPASLAGLVAGPFAALLGASSLVLHGPFGARGFLAACDATGGYHLVVPAAVGLLFADAALWSPLVSLTLVSRFADLASFTPPAPLPAERPAVDLYPFDEETVIAQRRVEGIAHPPARIADRSAVVADPEPDEGGAEPEPAATGAASCR